MFLSHQNNPKARQYLDFLKIDDGVELAGFLFDMTSHLNELTLKAQGLPE